MEIQFRKDINKLINISLPCAEIGCAEGNFSADMLGWGIAKLYMVDNWGHIPNITGDGNFPQSWHDENFRQAKERVAKYGERAVFLKGLSTAMAAHVPDNSLGLVYIDCDHSFQGVLNDLNAWYPKVIQDGIIAGHDFLAPQYQVRRAVEHFVKDKNISVHTIPELKEDDAGFWFQKK